MSHPPVEQGPFRMPMFKSFVPRRLQPWIYVLQLVFFQLSGGIYLGAMPQIQGTYDWLREDLIMCLNCNLLGMACCFPMLFRFKFRFTNQQLLVVAALIVGLGNLLTMHVSLRPLLWLICFIVGVGKIMGTFENVSNIMTWLTRTRNFSTFFPVLNTVLITCVTTSSWFSQLVAYHMPWQLIHLFTLGGMCFVLLVQTLLCKPFCPMPPDRRIPIVGVDFAGAALWVAFFAQVSYILTYGNHLDWYASDTTWLLTGTSLITLGMAIHRFITADHPYYSREVFTSYRNIVAILSVCALTDALLSCHNSIEPILYSVVLHYTGLRQQWLSMLGIVGVVLGGAFSFWWLRIMHYAPYKLIAIGFLLSAFYALGLYVSVSEQMSIQTLYPLTIIRDAASCILTVILMWSLGQMLPFEHFFQGLSIFNVLHMMLGSNIGTLVYTEVFQRLVADNASRYSVLPSVEQLLAISVKQLYGGVVLLLCAVSLLFFFWDLNWVRTSVRKMTSWSTVGIRLAASLTVPATRK